MKGFYRGKLQAGSYMPWLVRTGRRVAGRGNSLNSLVKL